MATRRLKTKSVYFDAILSGEKNFEIIYNRDVGLQKGDKVILCEVSDSNGVLTGKELEKCINDVTSYAKVVFDI